MDSIHLGITPEEGTTLTDVDSVPMVGLQLPRLMGVSVREGAATDVADLLGLSPPPTPAGGPAGGGKPGGVPASGPNAVPVPVLPKKC